MKVSVIIPNWNGESLLKINIPYLLEAVKIQKNSIAEIIVVDNGSRDGSVTYLEGLGNPVLKIVKIQKNLGFLVAVNRGVKVSKEDLICLLNNDVRVTNNFLVKPTKHFKERNVFGVGLHEKGEGPSIGYFKQGFIDIARGVENNKLQNTFWVSGGSGIFRKSFWQKLGGFDESLLAPFYWEDFDISYRAMKRGYKLLWEPDSLVYHEHESTSKLLNKSYTNFTKERNQLLVIWKNITSRYFLKQHILGLIKRTLMHPGYIRIIFAAMIKLTLIINKRRIEVKESRVADEEILSKWTYQ